MRPRINSFGKITRKELESYLYDNKVYGLTVKDNGSTYVYSYYMMYRSNKKDPEMIYLEMSKSSKLILKAWSEKGKTFNNVNELKEYVKK